MREDRSASGNARIGRIQGADARQDRPGLPPRFSTGVLNVDKVAGETSFSVVNRLRKLTGAHRVGHAGTLDPLATGVLPVLFESATRLAERSEEHTSELQSQSNLVCRLLLEKKKNTICTH